MPRNLLPHTNARPRRGVTLIELLISTSLTLLVMGAVATLFGQVGNAVNGKRQSMRMSENIRHAKALLISDLRGATALGRSDVSVEEELGYFELIEGPQRDATFAVDANTSILGDRDDTLLFTTSSQSQPFGGSYGKATLSSGSTGLPPTTPPPPVDCTPNPPVYLNNTDATQIGTAWGVGPPGYLNDHAWAPNNSGRSMVFTFSGLAPGVYQVSATWVHGTNRSSNSPFTIAGDTTQTVNVNQKNAPSSTHVHGGVNFQNVGSTVEVSTGTLSVTLTATTTATTEFVIADAIRVQCVANLAAAPPPPPPAAVDCLPDAPVVQGHASATFVGTWGGPWTSGYSGNHRGTTTGGASSTATWTFSGLTPGIYQVSATWVAGASRATNAPFTITGDTAQTVQVNQELAPANNHVVGGFNFQNIGSSVAVSGGTLTVRLTADANEWVIANGVRVQCVDNLPAPPAAPVPSVTVSGIKSNSAEVLWYTRIDPATSLATLYRRQLVVAPGIDLAGLNEASFFKTNDISARRTSGGMVANSLGDLSRREFRHARAAGFPYNFSASELGTLLGDREQEMVVLTNVLSFDVRVWDPGAPVLATDGAPVAPPPPPPDCTVNAPIVQDDGAASKSGSWPGPWPSGYNNNHNGTNTPGSVATWTFSGLPPGIYQVSGTWVHTATRATNAPYTIIGDTTQAVQENQRLAPTGDHVVGGRPFKNLGSAVEVSGGTLTVQLSHSPTGWSIADGIRVQCVGNLTPASTGSGSGTGGAGGPVGIIATDPGFTDALAGMQPTGYGSFVNLGVYAPGYTKAAGAPSALFNRAPSAGSQLVNTYCSWTNYYESDGRDQDGDGLIDEASDGFDTNGNGVIDDVTEREAPPPYPTAVKGVEIVIRVLEPGSRVVRQVTVRSAP